MSQTNIRLSVALTVSLLYYVEILIFASSSLLKDPDTLWHIRTGQWILDNWQFPTVDLFSYTAAGQRWISGEWLSEIIFLFAYNTGQWHGVVVLTTVTLSAIVGVLCFYLLRELRLSVAIGLVALTALAISSHFLARPHVFSYVLLVIWLTILLDSYDRGIFRPPLFALIFMIILWANLHPSFTFGLFLLGIFAGYYCFEKIMQRKYAECQRPIFVVFAVSLASLVNPYGLFSALTTLELFNYHFALRYISEWVSPNFQSDKIHLLLLVGLFSAIAGFGVRIKGPRLIVFAAVTYLGLTHTRGLTTFFLALPVILARPLSAQVAWCRPADVNNDLSLCGRVEKPDPVLQFLCKRFVAIPTICLVLAVFGTAVSWRFKNVGPDKSIAPKAAIDFVRKAEIKGNVFNSYAFGGYLIFSNIPTFIDGRMFPFTDEFIQKFAQTIAINNLDNALKVLDDYNVRWTLLLPREPLTKALAGSKSWKKIYADEYAVVFARRAL